MSDQKIKQIENIRSLNVGQIVDELSFAYSTLINGNVRIDKFPSVMLWGAPGVGKSQAVRQIAKEIEKETGKKTKVTDVRLLLFNPIDLRGIPTANADKTLAIWLKPQIFQMDDDPSVVNILFLDEISAAPQSVQAAAYQITLDRVIGEHRLPDNCIVIAAGNRTTDKSVAFKMPKALANRLLHLNVEGNFESWKTWAVKSGIHPMVIGFLSFKQSYLMNFDASTDDLAFATPRSWEMVSNILNGTNMDVNKAINLISGLVGSAMAIEFRTWTSVYNGLPDVEDIFAGKQPAPPTTPDALYALTSSIVDYARKYRDDMDKIANSIRYVNNLPADYSVIVLKDYLYLEEGYKNKLLCIPEFDRWMSEKGRLLNGID